uniref:Secreted protein n=1 Tax=Anguilla anguilla TaxID=7936 RepID=A0A0E9U3N5_ANGAN
MCVCALVACLLVCADSYFLEARLHFCSDDSVLFWVHLPNEQNIYQPTTRIIQMNTFLDFSNRTEGLV